MEVSGFSHRCEEMCAIGTALHKQHTDSDRTHASCLGAVGARAFLVFLRLPRTPHKTEPNAAKSKPDLVAGDERYRSPCSFAFIIYGAATRPTSRPWAGPRFAVHMCADIYGTACKVTRRWSALCRL